MSEQRCSACEAAIDVLDHCPECSGAPRPIGIRANAPDDPCKHGHPRRWDARSKRWRCDECSNRLRRLNRLKARS